MKDALKPSPEVQVTTEPTYSTYSALNKTHRLGIVNKNVTKSRILPTLTHNHSLT